jgi:hypothetical protein
MRLGAVFRELRSRERRKRVGRSASSNGCSRWCHLSGHQATLAVGVAIWRLNPVFTILLSNVIARYRKASAAWLVQS